MKALLSTKVSIDGWGVHLIYIYIYVGFGV